MAKRAFLLLSFLFLVTFAGASPMHAMLDSEIHRRVFFRGAHFPDFHPVHGQTEIAIYDDEGTWDAGKEGFKKFLIDHGIGYRTITAAAIRNGVLRKERFRALLMPGGESWQYLDRLGPEGAENIRLFVARGGGYLGICAGAFYATSHRDGGGAVGHYGIGLLQGVAYDGTARETPPFREGAMVFRAGGEGTPWGWQRDFQWLMLGGPSFRYSGDEAERKHIRVLARIPGIGEPAVILFQYGLGRVFLSAPHIEVDPSTIDSADFEQPDNGRRVLESAVNAILQR